MKQANAQNIAVNTSGNSAASTNMFEVTQSSGTTNTVGIFAKHNGAATNAYAIWAEATGTGNRYAIVVPSGSGSVGIGTTTPILPLHVISNGNTAPLYLKSNSTYDAFSVLPWAGVTYISSGVYYNNSAWVHDSYNSSNALIGIVPNGGVNWYNSNNSAPSWNVANGVLQWDVTGYWKNLVQSTAAGNSYFMGGNVGIGTTTPGYTLDLNGGTLGFGASNTRTEYRNDAGQMGTQSGFYQTAAPSPSADWPVSTPNATVNFDGSGNATSWWHLLDVRHSNTGNNYALQFSGGFFDQNLYFRKTNNSASQAWSQIYTSANGGLITCASPNFVVKADATKNGVCSQIYDDGINVGIGTGGAGAYKLDVNAPVNTWKGYFHGPDGYIVIGPANSGWAHIYTDRPNFIFNTPVYAMDAFSSYSQNLSLQTGGTTRITALISNGNVGIGQTAPNARLDVSTNGGSDGIALFQQSDNTETIQTYIDGQWTNRATYAGGCCNALALQPDVGVVGIGTTAPGEKLDVRGNITQPNNGSIHIFPEVSANTSYTGLMQANGFFADGVPWYGGVGREPGAWAFPYPDFVISNHTGIRLDAHSNYGGISFYEQLGPTGVWNTWSSTGSEIARFRQDPWGGSYFMTNVGIGVAPSGSYKLEVNGKIKTNNINETSDIRLKKDIVTIDNALDKVNQMRGVYFNWRTDEFKDRKLDSTNQIGVIAQEVEKIFPQVVGTDKDGYKSVEYSKLVAVLIEAMKEQQKTINNLQSAVGSLKTDVSGLKTENKTLKSEIGNLKSGYDVQGKK